MIKLKSDFTISKYGLDCRLVREEDVDFILQLRTNRELTKYIHQTQNDRDCQIEWIRDYKKREDNGSEYYFIFSYNGENVGLNRISSRSELYAVGGSWLCKPGIEPWIPIAINFIMKEIVFEVLNVQLIVCDVRKKNKKINKYHIMIGDVKIHESDIDNFYYATPNTFIPNRNRIIKLLNIK